MMLKSWLEKCDIKCAKCRNICYAHISHDVDLPYSIYKYQLSELVRKRFHFGFILPIDRGCKEIIKEEQKLGIKSSWYFMTGAHNKHYDFEYNLKRRNVKKLIEQLQKRGYDVGWHYSYDAAWNEQIYQKELTEFKDDIRKINIYGRNHYLRYNIPNSWRLYAKAELLYDASMGSAQHEGFIYGICMPFQLFDIVEGKNLQVWEIPLIVMDGTLRNEKYRNFKREQAVNCLKEYIQVVKKYDGCISVLWHNSSLNTLYWWKWRKVYKKWMHILAKECRCETGTEIINVYRRKKT